MKNESKTFLTRPASTIRGRLGLLLIAILVPILIVQVIIYHDRFVTRRNEQLRSSLETARDVAATFQDLVHDVLNQELSIGLALTSTRAPSAADIRRLLEGTRAAYPYLQRIMWESPDGRLIAASDSRTAGIRIPDRSLHEVVYGRGWAVSDLSRAAESGSPAFTVARAVRGPTGNLSGIVVSTVLVDDLGSVFPIGEYGGGEIVIFDRSGRAVLRSHKVNWTWEGRNFLNRIPHIKAALAGTEVTETIGGTAAKKKQIFAIAPIGTIGWAAAIGRSEEQALAPVYSQLWTHALMFSLVVLLAVLVFLLIANSISNPLKRLQAHALNMGRGKPEPLNNFRGPRELLDLEHALDFMAHELNLKVDELRQLNATLERRVAKRTALAEDRARQLQALASELTLTEQRERQRLAEVLHDHLQQLLVAARMNGEALSANLHTEQHKQFADKIIHLIAESIQASRSLTAELSPPILQRGGLSAALEWLARWMQENHGLKIELQTDTGLDPKGQDVKLLLFQSIRELLFNVVKHAGVKSARIEMDRDEKNRLRVTVSDQGSGLDPETIWEKARNGSGFGLYSIRRRLLLMDGSLEVASSPGGGASFSLIVPLKASN